MRPAHIHTPDDGRKYRNVFVNGQQVTQCFYADTKRGIAKCYREPLKVDKYGKRALSKTLRGNVVVEIK